MKLKFILPLFFYGFLSCSESLKKEYEGYVYDGNQPLYGVSITEGYVKDASYTKTNKLGYFKFNKSIKNFTPQLIFIKEGYKTDTVILTRGKHSGRLYTIFLRKKSDTLRMKKLEE